MSVRTGRPEKNPYRPGVGTRPLVLAGRDGELRRFGATLRAAPEIPANVRVTGLRGVGKTVLLSEYAQLAAKGDWATEQLELEPRHNTEFALVTAISNALVRGREKLSAVSRIRHQIGKAAQHVGKLGIEYESLKLTFEPGAAKYDIDLAQGLLDSVKAAQSAGRDGFVLMLDEAQVLRDDKSREGEHPLSLLLAAVTAVQKVEVSLGLVLCGLPTLTGNLLKARTYTERMFKGEIIGSLDASAARRAFVEPLNETGVSVEEVLVQEVLAAVEGYPYFVQLWGAELWDAAANVEVAQFTPSLLKAIEPDIYRRLDIDFYEPRVSTLTPAEQDLLMLAARCPYPPLRVTNIQSVTPKTPGNVNVLLGRLNDAGVIYRLRKGEYEYTAPKFHDYLERRAGATRATTATETSARSVLAGSEPTSTG